MLTPLLLFHILAFELAWLPPGKQGCASASEKSFNTASADSCVNGNLTDCPGEQLPYSCTGQAMPSDEFITSCQREGPSGGGTLYCCTSTWNSLPPLPAFPTSPPSPTVPDACSRDDDGSTDGALGGEGDGRTDDDDGG